MISARELEETLAVLPGLMKTQRSLMQPKRKGYLPGVRGAATALNMSPTTYCRAEGGHVLDLPTLIKILKWIES